MQGRSIPGTLGVDLHGPCFLMVNCMFLFLGRKTREMSSILRPMVPTEPRMLYFQNYLVRSKTFVEFANQLYQSI